LMKQKHYNSAKNFLVLNILNINCFNDDSQDLAWPHKNK